jgi:hypothetical protein
MDSCQKCQKEIQKDWTVCPFCGEPTSQAPPKKFPIYVKAYASGSRETMRERGEEAGLTEAQMEKFLCALYEVEVDLEVEEDGTAKIVAVNGRTLQ